MNENYLGTATYSPEDNKLRFYPFARLAKEDYDKIKAHGFIWAPKQELFVAPMWTPRREDLLIEWCGDIEDEDKSLVSRAEERADRFETYSENREKDADRAKEAVSAIADNIPFGQPILIGHHSERHARKDAERIENGMRKAVKMWRQSEYWKSRAAGAIRSAKYKEQPAVRSRRIKKLEAEQRKYSREKADQELRLKFWSGNLKKKDGTCFEINRDTALWFCNTRDHGYIKMPDKSDCWSAWSALEDNKITVEEIQRQRLEKLPRWIAAGQRWIDHYQNRIDYETAMLNEAGGIVTDQIKPEVGGACMSWVGFREIVKVNKVSVSVLDNWGNGGPDFIRTVKFDKISKLLTKAQYEEKKANDDSGLYTDFSKLSRPKTETPIDEKKKEFEAIQQTLSLGIQTITADNLFPTPPVIAKRMIELADIQPGHRVLEPSAGTGNLLREMPHHCQSVAVEINPKLSSRLCAGDEPWPHLVTTWTAQNFLECNGNLGMFDRVVMNPPFDHGDDIIHINHAMHFLKINGILVALCANGPKQQAQLKPAADYWEELPEGSFKNQGTNVNVALMVINNK